MAASLSDEDAKALLFDWKGLWARSEQLEPPGEDWDTWLINAGRGYGKTRTGAETFRDWAESMPGCRGAIVARTARDVRNTCIEGESGILAVCPPGSVEYFPGKCVLVWHNGFIAETFGADQPDLLRGPQFHVAWCDELAAWRRLQEAWDNLMFGLRLGKRTKVVVTTTPRPRKLIRELIKDKRTRVTRGSTFDNIHNLARNFREKIIAKYQGTRLGRQELEAEVLDDVPGALWTTDMIDGARVELPPMKLVNGEEAFDLLRIVVAVDPAVTNTKKSCETGIAVVGKGADGHYYVLADDSCKVSVDTWARRSVDTYGTWKADRIIGEVNNGGDLVESVIRGVSPDVPYEAVTASRGKRTRAEPISALYEQGKVHHVGNELEKLEYQMTHWVPDGQRDEDEGNDSTESDEADQVGSPDRVDALVWALTALSSTPDVHIAGL